MPSIKMLAFVAGLFAVILGGVASVNSFRSQNAAAVEAANIAREVAQRSLREASSAAMVAAAWENQAAVLDVQRAAAVARANATERNLVRLVAEFDSVTKTAPDTCRSIVETASAVMAAQDSTIADLRIGLAKSDSARVFVQTALDTTQSALARLTSATRNLTHADARLVKVVHPSFLARVLPHPTIGPAIGFDLTGVPRVVVGVSLGWNF